MTAYDWFKERELERIHGNSDFRFAASLFLHAGEHRTDAGLQAALAYAAGTKADAVPQVIRKDVARLASGQWIFELTDPVLGSDFADALLSYREAGGSVEADFSPHWAAGVIQRVLTGMPGMDAQTQAA